MTTDELYPAGRLGQVREAAGAAGLDAVLLTPGPDLRYVIGYDAKQLERLTCLVVPARTGPAGSDPFLVVPRLEVPAAQASPAGELDLEIVGWDETDDPYALVARRLGQVAGFTVPDQLGQIAHRAGHDRHTQRLGLHDEDAIRLLPRGHHAERRSLEDPQ